MRLCHGKSISDKVNSICKGPRAKFISSLFKEQWRSLSENGVKVRDGFKQRSGLTSIAILRVDREGNGRQRGGKKTSKEAVALI